MPIKLDDHDPRSLEDAIKALYNDLNFDETLDIRENGAERHHFGVGMAIRNAWIHPEGAPLAKAFIDRFGWLHADDMSGLILEGLTKMVRGEEYDPQPSVDHFKEHWRKCGINPDTGEGA